MEIKNDLSTNTLNNALAFSENSAQLFSEAVNQTKTLSSQFNVIYPPKGFPDTKEPIPRSTLRLNMEESELCGKISESEAVGMTVLLNECSALAQAWSYETDEQYNNLKQILRLPENGWSIDVIQGMSGFGNSLNFASYVRERILAGEIRPEKPTNFKDHEFQLGWDFFANAIINDDKKLGNNTAEAAVKFTEEMAKQDISNNPEGAKNEDDMNMRIISRKHGIILAKDLYLETMKLASTQLKSKVE